MLYYITNLFFNNITNKTILSLAKNFQSNYEIY